MAVAFTSLELVIRQPQGDPTPGEAFAPHLAPPGPQIGGILRGGVGVGPLIDEQVGVVFPVARMVALEGVVAAGQVGDPLQAVERLGAEGLLGRQVGTGLEYQHLEPRFGQHHGGNPTGRAGSHNDGVGRGEGLGAHSKKPRQGSAGVLRKWWRGRDLNSRPSGYEPDELPDCSTPRRPLNHTSQGVAALASTGD